MKTRFLLTAILTFFTSTAFAGLHMPESVMVDVDERLAKGDIWTARFSDGEADFIGCGIYTLDDLNGSYAAFAFCQARDANEVVAFCATQNEGLIEAIRAIADFSSITFRWDENDQCTDIGSSTQSYYLNDGMSKKDKKRRWRRRDDD